MMNPFTTGIAAIKILSSINEYNRHEKEFQALYDAGDYASERKLIREWQLKVIDDISRKCGFTYEIIGEENVPDDGPIMVYSNHQGFADIFTLVKVLCPKLQAGFIAKDEWRQWGPIARAIINTRSVFLVRGGGREAIKTLKEACELMEKGYNFVIFPEGTRARGPVMGEFKPGTLKFAQRGKVPILPVSIQGSYRTFEEKNSISKAHILVKVHPLVHIEEMDKKAQDEAFSQVEKSVMD